jgi:hypothetical protein
VNYAPNAPEGKHDRVLIGGLIMARRGEQDRGWGEAGVATASLRDRLQARLKTEDEDVEPHMGRRPQGGGGSVKSGVAKRLATGKMFGRGAAVRTGGPAASKAAAVGQDAISVKASQRVVVKAFVARHGGLRGAADPGKAIVGHVRYLARDGVGMDGTEAGFYGPVGGLERHEVREATSAWADDRHHFRLIISPEHGDRIEHLEGYVRGVMADVAANLKEPGLAWIAINHFDTDQPHAHVLIRGRRASGQTLVMPRRTISHTIRERAEARAQELLGDQSREQAERGLFVRARADRWTDIDMKLAALAERTGGVLAVKEVARRDTFGAIVRARVAHLEALGLAVRGKAGVTFAPDLKARLDGLQRSRDEIRSHWDRTRAQAFDGLQRRPKSRHERSGGRGDAELHAEADRTFPEATSDRLIAADIVLANRGQGRGHEGAFDMVTEAHFSARARHLTATGQARLQGNGLAYSAEAWSRLERAELRGAIGEQLGLTGRDVSIQPSVSEGRVMGHVETTLGRFAVVDRGVALAAVREMPGQALALGQVLGLGMQR